MSSARPRARVLAVVIGAVVVALVAAGVAVSMLAGHHATLADSHTPAPTASSSIDSPAAERRVLTADAGRIARAVSAAAADSTTAPKLVVYPTGRVVDQTSGKQLGMIPVGTQLDSEFGDAGAIQAITLIGAKYHQSVTAAVAAK